MNQTTHADEHAQETGLRWPVLRLGLHGAAAVLAVLAFAFLALELRGETTTSATAWVLLAFLLVLLAGQVALMVFGRDRVQAGQAPLAQEEPGQAWDSLDEPVWDAPTEASVEPEPAETNVITIGCPACSNTFHMNGSGIAGGRFHCPKCGVAGYLGQ